MRVDMEPSKEVDIKGFPTKVIITVSAEEGISKRAKYLISELVGSPLPRQGEFRYTSIIKCFLKRQGVENDQFLLKAEYYRLFIFDFSFDDSGEYFPLSYLYSDTGQKTSYIFTKKACDILYKWYTVSEIEEEILRILEWCKNDKIKLVQTTERINEFGETILE
jgi:hypothetical protein